MIADIVETLIRAAATEYALGVRQFWLFGGCKGQQCTQERPCIHRSYSAACSLRFPYLHPKPRYLE